MKIYIEVAKMIFMDTLRSYDLDGDRWVVYDDNILYIYNTYNIL